MTPDERSVHVTGEVFNHRLLWFTAQTLVARAREQREGSYHGYLGAVLFSYFAFEAFLNFLGSKIAPETWAQEKTFFSKPPFRGAHGKLRFLAEKTKCELDPRSRPWITLKQLTAARFAVTHAHAENVDEVFLAPSVEELPTHKPPILFRYGEPEFAERILEDAEHAADQLCQAALASDFDLSPHSRYAFKGTMWAQGGWLPAE